jgi:arylsulfatase A-like enzyme
VEYFFTNSSPLLFSTGLAAVYYGMVEEVDFWVGEILGALDSNGLWNNTLVIFSSDHGDLLGTSRMLSITFSPTDRTHPPAPYTSSFFLSQERTR